MIDIAEAVRRLPEPAIALFIEYAGSRSYHIGFEFAPIAECIAAGVITRAMRLNLLKSKDSKEYPQVFKRHAVMTLAKSLGIEFIRKTLANRQYLASRIVFDRRALRFAETAMPDPEITAHVLENLKDSTRKMTRQSYIGSYSVVHASIVLAMSQYKEFLLAASIEYLVAHAHSSAINF